MGDSDTVDFTNGNLYSIQVPLLIIPLTLFIFQGTTKELLDSIMKESSDYPS